MVLRSLVHSLLSISMKYTEKHESLLSVVAEILNFYNNLKRRHEVARRFSDLKAIARKYNIKGRPRGSVVLIVIDCLRYRNMSFTGYHRKTTPFLDRFPIKLRAYAPAPHTYSSVPSILSGLYPHNHGAVISGIIKSFHRPKSLRPLNRNVILLPEILKLLGYEVYVVSSIGNALFPLRTSALLWEDMGKVKAGYVLRKALKLLSKSSREGKDFFAYIHLGDLHTPLRPPKEYRNFFGEVKALPNIETWNYTRPYEQRGAEFEEYKFNRILLYDNTLRYVDNVLEWFVSELEDKVKNDLVILVTADHGEEFWEHADLESKYFYDPRGFYGIGHAHNLFNEIIEVPLLLRGVNVNKIHSTAKPISLVDLVPTILDWLGLEYHEKFFDGQSILGGAPRNRCVLSEAVAHGYEKKALIEERYKLLYSEGDSVLWLFDLQKDPMERNPITSEEVVSHMIDILKKMLIRDLLRRRLKRTVRGRL